MSRKLMTVGAYYMQLAVWSQLTIDPVASNYCPKDLVPQYASLSSPFPQSIGIVLQYLNLVSQNLVPQSTVTVYKLYEVLTGRKFGYYESNLFLTLTGMHQTSTILQLSCLVSTTNSLQKQTLILKMEPCYCSCISLTDTPPVPITLLVPKEKPV